MKSLVAIFCVLLTLAGYSVGQPPPAIIGDKNLEDRNIKDRSIDLERVDRDARKTASADQPTNGPNASFLQIKEDFEQIQLLQSDIVAAYTSGKEIDFPKISDNAEQIGKRGVRLKENLFPNSDEKEPHKAKKDEQPTQIPKDVKTLIVEMDNTLAAFTGNQMFTNPQVVDPDSNTKVKADLEKLIKLSAALKRESNKAMGKKD
jgi:hypothetical protein